MSMTKTQETAIARSNQVSGTDMHKKVVISPDQGANTSLYSVRHGLSKRHKSPEEYPLGSPNFPSEHT